MGRASDVPDDVIAQAYREGITVARIRRTYHIGFARIRRICEERGILMRNATDQVWRRHKRGRYRGYRTPRPARPLGYCLLCGIACEEVIRFGPPVEGYCGLCISEFAEGIEYEGSPSEAEISRVLGVAVDRGRPFVPCSDDDSR